MGSTNKPASWLIDQMEQEKATFDNKTSSLQPHQKTAFENCLKLLQEYTVPQVPKKRPRYPRVRILLADIFMSLGPEVFLLCTLSASLRTLASVSQKGLVIRLRNWWDSTSKPRGLSSVATALCDEHEITSVVAPQPKRLASLDSENTVVTTSQPEDKVLPIIVAPIAKETQAKPIAQVKETAEKQKEEPECLDSQVYKLTEIDIVKAAVSDQVEDDIRLTVPTHKTVPSFITISISDEMVKDLVRKRPRIM